MFMETGSANSFGIYAKHLAWDDYLVLVVLALVAAAYVTRHKHVGKPNPQNYKWYEKPQGQDTNPADLKFATRNIATKLETSAKDLVVFWGSQSGTAERFAHQFAKRCWNVFKVQALVADLSDYDPQTLASIRQPKFAIFLLSTFGEGDPSDNTIDFFQWLSSANKLALQSLHYAAFGLGNSNYKYYNQVVNRTVESFDRFGANLMFPVGRADDADGTTEEDFLDWTDNLFKFFESSLGWKERSFAYEPCISVVLSNSHASLDTTLSKPISPKHTKKFRLSVSPVAPFPIREARELFQVPTSDRRCVHMQFDLSSLPQVKYKTGDHLAVWPLNSNEEVDRLLCVLGLGSQKDLPLYISSLESDTSLKVPTYSTARALFQHHLNISAPISRDTIRTLTQFAPTSEIRILLTRLANDNAAFIQFSQSHHLNFGRLLELTKACWHDLPLSLVIESLAPIVPRYYSISSSAMVKPRTPSITAVAAKSILPREPNTRIVGLATSYLSALTPLADVSDQELSTYPPFASGQYLHAQIRRSRFKLPASNLTPLILVAAGTGLAPFRAFLQERARLVSIGREIGSIDLYFGCRDPEVDFIYKEEIESFASDSLRGYLRVTTAFSRSPCHQKAYVQDRICDSINAPRVVKLLTEDEAGFYLCGSAAMARDVTARLTDCLKLQLGWDEATAKHWFDERRQAKRWHEDVWG